MILINLFGVPGAGKSSGAAYIFSKLKMAGVNAELVTEFAKEKVWEENKAVFKNQAYIFGKQFYRITRCEDKVDLVITDSPLPLSVFYNDDPRLGDAFNKMIMSVFNSYECVNYLIHRVKPYNPKGRHQTEEESNALEKPMIRMLKKYNIKYSDVNGSIEGYDSVVAEILKKINN